MIKDFVENLNVDLLLLQEIWRPKTLPQLNSFHPAEAETRKRSRGGGVAIWVRNTFNFERLHFPNLFAEGEFEFVTVKVQRAVFTSFYRPPNASLQPLLNGIKVINDYCQSKNLTAFFAGDANINWSSDSNYRVRLKNFIELEGLKQTVANPTRPGLNPSTIDHFYTSITNKVRTKVVQNNIGDHHALIISTNTGKQKQGNKKGNLKQTFFSYNDKNISKIKLDINNYDWDTWERQEANDMATNITNFLEQSVKKYCTTQVRKKDDKFCHSRDLMNLSIKCRNINRKINSGTPSPQLINKLRTCRLKYQRLYRVEKDKYYMAKIQSCRDKKGVWDTIKKIGNISKQKATHPHKLELDNRNITDPAAMADAFNNYYRQIAQILESKLPKPKNPFRPLKKVQTTLSFQDISPNEVLAAINNLQSKKSHSKDCISNALIKKLRFELLTPLTKLFNKCFNEGVFPDCFKLSRILPLYKNKGSRSVMGNYRPISLLSSLSKVLEKVISKRTYTYFFANNYFNKNQHGFRYDRNTTSALLKLLPNLNAGRGQLKYYCGIFVDLSKAFDTLNLDILIKTLASYGLDGKSVQLLSSYLTGRKQYVDLGSHTSTTIESGGHGVPQGSVLGPLLFLIYVNNFSSNGPYFLFADDTCLVFTGGSINELRRKVIDGLDKCSEFFLQMRLSFNVSKTYYLTNCKNLTNLTVNNIPINKISPEENFKYLGLNIGTYPKPNSHVNNVKNKMLTGSYFLAKIRNKCGPEIKKAAYFAMVESHLSYAITCWGPYVTKEQSNQLIKIQKRCVRVIFGLPHRSHTGEFFKKSKILYFPDLIKYHQALIAKKFFFNNTFTEVTYRGGTTRNKNELVCTLPVLYDICKEYNRQKSLGIFDPVVSIKKGVMTEMAPSLALIKKRMKKEITSTYITNCNIPNCLACPRGT